MRRVARKLLVRRTRLLRYSVETLESRALLSAQPIISEFMAVNRDTLLDGLVPPESSDWIELHNAGDTAIDLNGWHLTDNSDRLDKWTFPSVQLAAGQYLVVFASGQESPDGAGNIHTNFRLSSSGEYLALVEPDGRTIASQFGTPLEDYPRQVPDVSFGVVMQATARDAVTAGALTRVLVPTSAVDGDWTGGDPAFVDDPLTTDWMDAVTPIGFGVSEPQPAITVTDVDAAMRSVNSSALARIAFEVSDLDQPDAMLLRIAHDDGYVAFLNGQRIAEANAPTPLRHDSAATATHDALADLVIVDPDAVSVLYDFEHEGGQDVTDRLTADGQQNPSFNSGGSIDSTAARAAFGARSLRLPDSPGPASAFNRLRLPGTSNLGEQFTLAVHADLSSDQFQRLFSNYNGTGPVADDRLIFDVDPSGSAVSGLRVLIGNRGALETAAVPAPLLEPGYHHFAMTYDFGDVQVYLDGQLAVAGTLGDGPLNMPMDLFFGEDPHDGGGTANEQLVGNVDDLLVLSGTVLSPTEIQLLAREGADALLQSGRREPFYDVVDVSEYLVHLRAGRNILAVQGLNIDASDEDFFLLPELTLISNPDGLPPAYFSEPTPGKINSVPLGGIVGDTTFSVNRGFFDEPFSVDISVATPGATIVYTTDGSEPSLTNGIQVASVDQATPPLVTLPIDTTTTLRSAGFKQGFAPSNVDTQTYLFLNDVVRQPAEPDGLPDRWGPTRADYEMDAEIVDSPPYREMIIDSLKSIPTVSLTLNSDDFFGPSGIYSNTLQRGREWERPVSVEYFDAHTEEEFQLNAGLRVHGGFSRDPTASPQHSLRLHFRSEYGPGKLRFPLFDDSTVSEFDALVLNAQSSDNWTSINLITGRAAQFMRDQWAQDMQGEMGHVHVPGKYVHVYINGLYWGLYGLMERPDDDFAAAHSGGTEEEYDVIVDEVATSGDLTAWRQLLSHARDGDYEKTLELLDVDNFIDYMILNMYMGNWDWPDHNWNAVRRRAEGEKFRFLVWDAEVGLGIGVNVPGPIRPQVLDFNMTGDRPDVSSGDVANGPGEIYDRLRTIPEFQLRFADRLHKHLFNDGALTTARAAAVYQALAIEIESALVAESARWGDVRRTAPDTPDGVWTEEKNWILTTFFAQRGDIVLTDFREEDLYPAVAAPIFNQHGGAIESGFHVSMRAAQDPLLVETPILPEFSPVTVLVPRDGTLDSADGMEAPAWTTERFDDSQWIRGLGGVGFEQRSGYESLLGVDLLGEAVPVDQSIDADANGSPDGASFYARFSFELDASFDPNAFDRFFLRTHYDDGFAAYLNGQLILRQNAPESLVWDARATRSHEAELAEVEEFDVTDHRSLLQAGKNVLAIHGLNRRATSNDLVVSPSLLLGKFKEVGDGPVYYTLDGTDPRLSDGQINAGSAKLFEQPFALQETTEVRARALVEGMWSAITEATFNVRPTADFNSDRATNIHDLDLLCAGLRGGETRFDLNQDGAVGQSDVDFMLTDILQTVVGDTNLDGLFNSSDLVAVFALGEYEDTVAGNSTWSSGDWNCDGDFGTADLVAAFRAGAFTATATSAEVGDP